MADPFEILAAQQEEDEQLESRRRAEQRTRSIELAKTPPVRPSLPQRVLQTNIPGTEISIGDAAEELLQGFAAPARAGSAIVGGAAQSLGRGVTATAAGILSMLRGDQTTTPTVRRAVKSFEEATDPFIARPETPVGKAAVGAAALPFTAGIDALKTLGLTEEAAQGAADIVGLRIGGRPIAKVAGRTGKAVFRELRDLGERGEVGGRTAGIKNESINAARVEAGLRPAKHGESIKFSEEMTRAVETEKANPGEARRLAERISKEPTELSTGQEATLLVEEVNLKRQLREAKDRLNETPDNAAGEEIRTRIAQLEQEFQNVGDAVTQSGTLQAQAFAFRKVLAREDFSLESMVRETRNNKGGERLTPQETAKVEASSKKIDTLEKALATKTIEAAEAQAEASKPIKQIFEEAEQPVIKTEGTRGLSPEEGRRAESMFFRVEIGKEGIAPNALKPIDRGPATDIQAVKPREAIVKFNFRTQQWEVVSSKIGKNAEVLTRFKKLLDSKTPELLREVETVKKAQAEITPKDPFAEKARGEKAPRKPKTDEELAAAGEASLAKQITDLEARLERGDLSPRTGKKGFESPEMKAQRAYLKALNKEMRTLREIRKDKKTPEQLRLGRLITRMKNQTIKLQERRRSGQLEKEPVEPVRLDEEGIEAKRLLDQEKELFAEDLFNLRRSRRGVFEIGKDILVEGLSLSRALVTAGEMSGVLRQGGPITLGSPTLFWATLKPYFEAMRSESKQAMVEHNIANSPNALNGNYARMRLDFTKKSLGLKGREETQTSRIADLIPGVAGSQRGFVTGLNALRAKSADVAISLLEKDGGGALSTADFRALGEAINTATGRGTIGVLARPFVALNGLFFAPRLVFSRMKLLVGQPIWQAYYKGSPRAAKIIARQYAKTLMGIAALTGVAVMAGAEVETDSRSSDFAKWRFGKTRVDPWMGVAQIAVFTSRELSGQAKSLASRKIRNLTGEDAAAFGGSDRFDTAVAFLRTKFSPGVSAGIDLFSGQDVIGKQAFLETAAAGLVVPMAYRDVYDVIRDQGVGHIAALSILINFGMGMMTFDPKEKRRFTRDQMPERLRKRFDNFVADARKMLSSERQSSSIRGTLGGSFTSGSTDPFLRKAEEGK